MASIGAIAAVTAGVALGVFAESKGQATPAGEIGRAVGADISGGAVGGETPILGGPAAVDTAIDQGSVRRARTAEAERLRKRRGRASTIQRKKAGLLGAETTGGLLGG